MDQAIFEMVYRGRQRWYHHLAYMRMGKVLLALEILRQAKVCLPGKRVLDFGFGSGTLLRSLPRSALLFGIEQDEVACEEAAAMLRKKGFAQVDLRPLDLDAKKSRSLLQESYDLVVLSHVLEHLSDPVGFLKSLRANLMPGGLLLGLVPIHEREKNPHHLQVADAIKIRDWASRAGFCMRQYQEGDPWFFWIQPLFNHNQGWRHRLAQLISFGFGCIAALLGPRVWLQLGRVFEALTGSRPTQAGFILSPE
jgi:2-polyprenyl-3-methyl-5-hydroxy-6-metoxy-1,4-benzoquinol methylase